MTTYHNVPASPPPSRTDFNDPVLDQYGDGEDLSWLDGPTLEEENSDSDEEEDGAEGLDPRASTEDAAVNQVGQPLVVNPLIDKLTSIKGQSTLV